ncbi:hypothetical protein GUJ93_ZPchr0011g28297 [Zizania palustris]|uniref:Glycosyl transferase family 3 N-terminal domain-containing protein n=1 Tax=Zizania palustris TaxID=103762 RepID=A0A8J5WII0_ZIZPA|nr:hypothetical protein GUJ93_ZPchr0011g28297 [Zizania palustris]
MKEQVGFFSWLCSNPSILRAPQQWRPHRSGSPPLNRSPQRRPHLLGARLLCARPLPARLLPACVTVLEALIGRDHFLEEEAETMLRLLLEDKNEAHIVALLVLLSAKGETYEEMVGLVKTMMSYCVQVEGLNDAMENLTLERSV